MSLLVLDKIFLIIKTTPGDCCKKVLEERVMLILWKLLIEKHRDLRILFGIARNNELCETTKLRKFWEDSIYIYLVRSMLNNKCQTYFCMVLGNFKDSVCIFEDVFHIIFWMMNADLPKYLLSICIEYAGEISLNFCLLVSAQVKKSDIRSCGSDETIWKNVRKIVVLEILLPCKISL